MSAGSLTGGVLSLKKLIVGGATFTGGSGVSGLSAGGGTTTANPVPFTSTWATTGAPGSAPTATFTASAGNMALALVSPPLGGGGGTTVPTLWSNTGAYAVGAVVSVGTLADPTGTFICILAVSAPVSPAVNTAPSATPASWTPVAPLKPTGTGITELTGTGGTPTTGTSIAFTSTVSGAGAGLSFVPSVNGMALTGTITGGTGGTTVPTLWSDSAPYAVGAVVSVGTLANPTGTFICILAVSAPVSPAVNTAPSATPASWTPVAPLASAGASAPLALVNPGATVGTNPANPSWVAPTAPATSPYTLTLTNAQLAVCQIGSTAFPAQTGIFQNAVWNASYQLVGTQNPPVAPVLCPQYNPTAGVNPTTYVFQSSGNPNANALVIQLLHPGS